MNDEEISVDGETGYDIPPAPEPRKVLTAFLVVIEPNGTTWAHNDVNQPLEVERAANIQDMYRACMEVAKDAQVIETTQRVVQAMIQTTAQIAESERASKLAQKLNLTKSGLHVPS